MPDLKATISMLIFPRKVGCRICDLCADNEGLRVELTERLANGQKRTEIVGWLKSLGHKVSVENLYRHYARHIKSYLEPMLQIQREIIAEQEAIGDLDPDQLAAALGTNLLRQVLSAAKRLQLEIIAMRIIEPGDAIEFLDKATKLVRAIADIERAKTTSDLNERMIQLRELELLAKQGNLDALASRYLKSLLAQHPAVAEQIMKLLRPLLPAAAARMLPATPNGVILSEGPGRSAPSRRIQPAAKRRNNPNPQPRSPRKTQ